MSNSNPELIIIAGPNGAGKSTTSKDILSKYGVKAFDWDAEFYKQWGDKYNFDPAVEQGVRDATTDKFEHHIEEALKTKTNVAYETNFHVDSHFKRAEKAKQQGFNTTIIFFFVDNLNTCNARVNERYSFGGHYVDPKTVEYRWVEGLKRLNTALLTFDRVFIYDTTEDYEVASVAVVWEKELLSWSPSEVDKIAQYLPNLKAMLF